MIRGPAMRRIVLAFTLSLFVWLLAGCATARPTSVTRTPGGYEVLSGTVSADGGVLLRDPRDG